jgi:hypothetical protein
MGYENAHEEYCQYVFCKEQVLYFHCKYNNKLSSSLDV